MTLDYDALATGESYFARWERGERTSPPAPLAIRSRHYRALIVRLLQRFGLSSECRIISLGAGNGFAEVALTHAGFDVLATDLSDVALSFCEAKRLKVLRIDVQASFPSDLGTFDALYADGLLGHIYDRTGHAPSFWVRASSILISDGILLLSNDLSDHDEHADWTVAADPNASFFRPPRNWFAADATASRLWRLVWSDVLTYRRPGRGLRRRELVVLARAY
jgi:SAM-dependent methyltransferase